MVNLHAVGVENLVTQEPVPELYSDGSPSGRSAVDIWVMLRLAYDDAQSYSPPRVTYVLQKRRQSLVLQRPCPEFVLAQVGN